MTGTGNNWCQSSRDNDNKRKLERLQSIKLGAVLCVASIVCYIGFSLPIGSHTNDSNEQEQIKSVARRPTELGPTSTLRGLIFLDKTKRLVLHWENGDFQIWDTTQGRRLDGVRPRPRNTAWFVPSPDQCTILTADCMPGLSSADIQLQISGFVPHVEIWDVRSGERKATVEIPEAMGHPYYIHEWHATWLDNSNALVFRLLRENPLRAASKIRLILINAASGKLRSCSDDFEWAGERLSLSPNAKLCVAIDDNRIWRADSGNLNLHVRNANPRTHVFSLETLKIISSWRDSADNDDLAVAVGALWLSDNKSLLIIDDAYLGNQPAPRVRLWNAPEGKEVRVFKGHSGLILDMATTADNNHLLTASDDRTVRLWNLHTGKTEAILTGHSAGLNRVIVLKGDKTAVSVAQEPTAKVWDLTTGKLLFDLPDHDSAIRSVEAVSDNSVRTLTIKGTSTIWNCTTGKKLKVDPKLAPFPANYGSCVLVEESGRLFMRSKD
jgi:WD40 repeat protein